MSVHDRRGTELPLTHTARQSHPLYLLHHKEDGSHHPCLVQDQESTL